MSKTADDLDVAFVLNTIFETNSRYARNGDEGVRRYDNDTP